MVRYLPDWDIGELAEGTERKAYSFRDCINKYESNATLQFSTKHKTNNEKFCNPFVFSTLLLLAFYGNKVGVVFFMIAKQIMQRCKSLRVVCGTRRGFILTFFEQRQ